MQLFNHGEFISYGHWPSNEVGREEVHVEYRKTFLQRLLHKPNTTKVWYRRYWHWYDKATDERASDEEHELISLICYVTSEENALTWH